MSDLAVTHPQLLWRCRRGMLELDLLLRGYAENHFWQASTTMQQQFLLLLEHSDQQLQQWLVTGDSAVGEGVREIVQQLRPRSAEVRCGG